QIANHFGRGEDVEFKKALAKFVLDNLYAAEKLQKGKVEPAKDDAIIDEVSKAGMKATPITDPVTSKEIALLANSDTPFSTAAKEAQAGRMTADQYRAAQTKVGEKLVREHQPALKKIQLLFRSFHVNPETRDRLASPLTDDSGKTIDNPHGRM